MYGFDGHQQQGDFGTFIVQSAATTSYGRGSGGRGHRGGGAGGNFQPAEFSGAYRGGSGASPNPSAYANNAGGWNPQNQHQSPPRNLLGGAGMTVTAGNANSALPNAGGGDDVYEVHDNQLKAPVSIRHQDVLPTHGSHRLFSAPPQQLNAPGQTPGPSQQRNPARICESYQHGQCLHGEECPDVHVVVDVLHNMRQQMVAWLMSKEEEFNGTAARAPETTFRVFAADLKEVVDVPIGALSFTRGLYVDPSARAKRSRYGQQSAFALMAAQVPTACGLHSVDPTQCKWGRWCNQAHIDPMWMRMKRGEFESWSRTLEQQYEDMPDDHVFVVHDPQIKTALQIPKIAIAGFSRGLFQGNAKKAPSVCMLYQRGRCTAGSCCNQIHIFADYIVLLRQYLADGNPELLFAMQQVAMQQKQLLQMQQQQQQQQQQIASTLGQLNSGHLNPGARPFVPPGAANAPVAFDNAAAGTGNGYSAQQPLQGVRLPAQSSAHPFTKADTPGGAVSPKLGDSESMLPPPMVNFAPLAAMSNDDPAGRGGSLHSSPHLGPGSPHSAMRQVLSHSPYRGATAVSGLLADLRADDDEVYVERGRRPSANPMSASQSSPMTPMKRNNPYQQAQKPIGVPPSPLHGIALPASAVAPMSQHQTAAQQHMERSIPHTPPMSFGWVPQARMPPSMGGLPPPPSPYRSSFLKNNTPTSPHHNPTTYTPDLSHMYFSPSPLLRSADSMSYMPKNMSLDAFEDFHLQQSLHSTTTAPPNTYAHQASHSNTSGGGGHAPVSTSGGSSYAGPPFSPGSGSLAPPAASNNQYTAVGPVRQSQPYQQTSMPNSSSQSSSTPSRVGNGTPVDQSGGAARTT